MPDLSDEQLSSELRRRAVLSSGAEDWTRGRLGDVALDAVRTQPSAVATSRASRWLSLAAVVAALVLLVVALPSLNALPGPGQPTAPPSPALAVLTTSEFASQLAARSLDGQTVLVDGRIVSYSGPATLGGICDQCLIGELDGVTPRLIVMSDPVAVPSADESTTTSADAWPYWKTFEAPIDGILVLSVSVNGDVGYLGRVLNGDPVTWSPTAVQSSLDLNSRALDEVVLVDAWLGGSDVVAGCPQQAVMSYGRWPSLERNDACAPTAWLTDDSSFPGSDEYYVAGRELKVQSGAYASFAPDQSVAPAMNLRPQRAIYAISKRLYGGACIDDSQPCWNWAIVGRLSQPAAEAAPSAVPGPPTPTIGPSLPPGAREVDCGDYRLLDYTDVVNDCTSEGAPGASEVQAVTNPGGDLTRLEARWTGATCAPVVQLELRSSGSSYVLDVQESNPGYPSAAPSCAGGPVSREIMLTLNQPVAADRVEFTEGGLVIQTPAPPSTLPAVDAPVSGSDTSGDFTLTISSPHSVYSASDAIDVQAALSLAQGAGSTSLSGSGSGLIVFGIKQLDGTRQMDGISTADCALGRYTVSPADPLVVPFWKGGGFSASDPDAAFWRSYFADPLLHLPAGEWEISADASFDEGAGCSAHPTNIHAVDRHHGQGRRGTPTPTVEPVPTGYSVKIDQGLQPQWNAAAAAQAVFEQIKANERAFGVVLVPAQIISVEAMTGKDIPDAAGGPDAELPIAWVVHARGAFRNDTGPNPSSFHFFAEAWYVFADDGSLIGLHLTDQQPEPSASAP